MDPQLDERLHTIEKKLDENAIILQRLYRAQRRSRTMKYVYWGIVIALGFVSLSLVKPYLSQLGDAYGIGGGANNQNLNDVIK